MKSSENPLASVSHTVSGLTCKYKPMPAKLCLLENTTSGVKDILAALTLPGVKDILAALTLPGACLVILMSGSISLDYKIISHKSFYQSACAVGRCRVLYVPAQLERHYTWAYARSVYYEVITVLIHVYGRALGYDYLPSGSNSNLPIAIRERGAVVRGGAHVISLLRRHVYRIHLVTFCLQI